MNKLVLALSCVCLMYISCKDKSQASDSAIVTQKIDTLATVQTPLDTTNTTLGNEVSLPSGLKINFSQRGNGVTPKAGDIVIAHYTGYLTNGTKFDSSKDRNQPFEFPLGQGNVIKGWDEGFANMKVGDKAKLTIPPALGYGVNGSGATIPPNATLIFDVELLGIKAAPKPQVLWNYKTKTVNKTASGLKYYIIEQGNGLKPKTGNTVSVHYTGFLPNGTKFDSSVERGDPIQFPVGKGQVIKGWDEGILLLPKGTKAVLEIPPNLAYGPSGAGKGVIPPNSPLFFNVEIVDFK